MRILPVRTGREDEDIASGRNTLAAEMAHPAKTVMVIRGNTPEVAQFADLAAARSDAFGFREAVWVQDDRIFTPVQLGWFQGRAQTCAVVLNFDDQPIEWLTPDAMLFDIERAFLRGQQGG